MRGRLGGIDSDLRSSARARSSFGLADRRCVSSASSSSRASRSTPTSCGCCRSGRRRSATFQTFLRELRQPRSSLRRLRLGRRDRRSQRARRSLRRGAAAARRRSSRSTRSSSSRARTGATSPIASCICSAPTARRTALSRFRPPQLDRELAHARDLLSMPSAQIKALVQQDPLGLLTMLRDRMGREKGFVSFDPTQEGYVSPDGRSRLVIVKPKGAPFDTDFCKALFAAPGRRRSRGAARRGDDDPDAGAVEHPGGRRVSRVARGRAADSARKHRELDRLAGPAAARRVRRVSHAVGRCCTAARRSRWRPC